MGKIRLACKCNNKEELIECLNLLKLVGINWAGVLKIDIRRDVDRFNYEKPIIIFLNQQGRDFEITYSIGFEFKYGYNTSDYTDKISFVVNIKKFTEAISHYYRTWKK